MIPRFPSQVITSNGKPYFGAHWNDLMFIIVEFSWSFITQMLKCPAILQLFTVNLIFCFTESFFKLCCLLTHLLFQIVSECLKNNLSAGPRETPIGAPPHNESYLFLWF